MSDDVNLRGELTEDEIAKARARVHRKKPVGRLPQTQQGTCSSDKCGRKILWIRVEGANIPIDIRRVRLYLPPDETQEEPHWRRGALGYIGHHQTCPDVERFKK